MEQEEKEELLHKKAVALKYDQTLGDGGAPKVVAKGKGFMAEEIISRAHENSVPIREDHDLVELLSHIDLDQEIPAELYRAVAEVLSWVYHANEELKEAI